MFLQILLYFCTNINYMRAEQFKRLSQAGESAVIEYKTCTERISSSLYETVCSFLNHSGGQILVGVKDNGEIVGVSPDKAEALKTNIITTIKNQNLFLPCPYFTPQSMEVNGKTVILLDIPCGEYVYRYNGRYWDRNGDADIDITDHPELLLSLFERKNPHLFEERTVSELTMAHLDHETFQFCRNILSIRKPGHAWLQLTDEEILLHTHLAKRDSFTGELKLKYASLILFGKEEAIEDFIPRYRFEALFHMCTYEEYNDLKQFPNRYDDRKTMRYNLIKVYSQLTQFTERYLPDRFYLPPGSSQREDLRWQLFREIIANLCVHTDYSTGYACFYHVFKDRVVTENPTRLSPEIPEGKLTLQQLNNYTKNPLLVRVFRELSWVEDMGSGIRNILRYAPLYFPHYKVEITNGSQFIFSITYIETLQGTGQMSPETGQMSPETGQMSPEFIISDFVIPTEENKLKYKKSLHKEHKRQQGIIGLINQNSQITVAEMAEKLDVNERTIHRDIEELTDIVAHVGPTELVGWSILQ